MVDGHFDECGLSFTRIEDIDDVIRRLTSLTCPGKANRIIIDHGGGIVTQYYHLKRGTMQVAPGDEVSCDQKLAQVGSSGRSLLPHLHFDVIDNGAHVDPFGVGTRSYWTNQGAGRIPLAACP